MANNRVQIKQVLQSQLPNYVKDEFPLIASFLTQYFSGLEFQGGPIDLIQNIDSYIKLNSNANTISETELTFDADESQDYLDVSNTVGFPENSGILQIDDEIIIYRAKVGTRFLGCSRGFVGVTSFENPDNPEEAVFSTSSADSHLAGSVVRNLSVLFLQEFLKKIKAQFLPGLQSKELSQNLNQAQFIRQSKDFYSTRGTEDSFKILFKALYNDEISIIRPKDYLFTPSNASYQITRDLIVESVEGDPYNLLNKTLFQDSFENIGKAYAPVSFVEKIIVGVSTDNYYKISIDTSYNKNDGSTELLYGDFSVHAKTQVIDTVSVGQTYFEVDSTIGFPQSGTLSVTFLDGTSGIITYSDKSPNQFLGITTTSITGTISDGTVVDQNTYAYGFDDESGESDGIKIKVRSVLNNLQKPSSTYYQSVGSKIKIKSLGKISSDTKANHWFFNTAQYYDVENLTLEDSSNNTYKLITKDSNILRIGDSVELTDRFTVKKPNDLFVVDVFDERTCLIRGSGVGDPSTIVKVSRRISRTDSSFYPELNKFPSNVQNTYLNGDKVLVSTNSLPYFLDTKLNPRNQKITLSGTFTLGQEILQISSGLDHNFYTGDVVYYTPQKNTITYTDAEGKTVTESTVISYLFDEGNYIVKRIDSNNIKLAKGVSDLYAEKFLTVTPVGGLDTVTIAENTLEKAEFRNKAIKPQKIYRQISTPTINSEEYETKSGYTGILINGIEILNYKSKNYVHYGVLESIDISSGGENYDVVNPPVVNISDSVGTGATGICAVKGEFKEIRVLNSGFDYVEIPKVKITGGNGSGATADVNLVVVPHQVSFNPTGVSTDISGIGTVGFGSDASTIGFTTYHKFRNGERVVYKTFGERAISGLSTDAVYHVSVQSPYIVKLHNTLNDSVLGINTVVLTSAGAGVHELKSLNGKSVVGSVTLTNAGSGYETKQRLCSSSGINTALNTVTINNHGYKTGEIVKYSFDGTAVSGLSTTVEYYVTEIDQNTFKLSSVGVGTTAKDFYLNTKQYEDFASTGVGTHSFNYPPVSVEVVGNIGIASTGSSKFKAILQPIVRGEITSIQLTNTGVGYGSSEIINFKREPDVTLRTGTGALLEAVVSESGKIIDVIVNRSGQEYNSPPTLVVSGIGSGANLVPKLLNGQIVGVEINKSGVGYGVSTTTIEVKETGSSAKFIPNIQKWTINNFGKNLPNINSDDVFISEANNTDFELQCSYVYAPRTLRKVIYSVDQDGNPLYGKKDLEIQNGQEVDNTSHSSIIGWSYDGYPIYGPYAYSTTSGGSITQMKSGYSLSLKPNRPPTSAFPEEFFVEDFEWRESTDESVLDENNGRFCVTPDFPNGTYAYFATFDRSSSTDGAFKNFKKPSFPYLIGKNFQSSPDEFNYDPNSNHDEYDVSSHSWIRNTYPYALNKEYSGYDYLQKSYDLVDQDSTIKSIQKGYIDNIGIETGGTNYKVNDRVVFEKEPQSQFFSASRVSKILGASPSAISVARTEISNVEFYPIKGDGTFLGIGTAIHGFKKDDVINVSGLSTTSSFLDGSYEVGVSTNYLTVSKFIATDGVTGIVTYISISGNIEFPQLQENDILGIGTGSNSEQVKVLNVDKISSRLRVLRSQNGAVGVSHTLSTRIEELSRRVLINVGYKTSFNDKVNKEYYFNPVESLGISSVSGVGIGTTVFFSNPGSGVTEIFVPAQSLYLPNHKLLTGDEVTYRINSGDAIGVSTVSAGSSFTLTDNSTLFVAKLSTDLIGLSTVKVGLGTTGTFVGIASTTSGQGLLYFIGVGTGVYHSLVTNYSGIVKGSIDRNLVTVSTSSTNGLLRNDTVFVDVNPSISTSVSIRYNTHNRKMTVGSLDFGASGITTSTNTITLSNHGLTTGQKVIHTAVSPATGLTNNEEYYAYVVDRNNIRLCDTKYQTTKTLPSFVNISTQSSGSILPINPPLTFYRNSTVTFDVSDSSLSYTRNSTKYPAFALKFYLDSEFTEEYVTNGKTSTFNVSKSGDFGSSGSTVTLTINSDSPKIIYYRLEALDIAGNLQQNLDIVVDDEIHSNNQLLVKSSLYNGTHIVSGVSTNSFNYTIKEYPEADSYSSSSSTLSYTTNSKFAYGPIAEVESLDRRLGYSKLPGISTITTLSGTGAVLNPSSKTIGRVLKTQIDNIGFNYPSDSTLSPQAILPQVLKLSAFYKFKSVGITSFGLGYTTAPSLVVIDGGTKKKINDVDLRYTVGSNKIEIKKNTLSLTNNSPTIIPTGNPNGIRVSNLEYDPSSETVKVTMKEVYSENFPISVGDKVLVENSSVGVGTTAKGFNSNEYDYALFTVTAVHPNLGGNVGFVTYSFADYLGTGESLGVFDSVNSSTVLVPEKYFPQFKYELESNSFQKANEVVSEDAKGTVFEWDEVNQLLTVESSEDFAVNEEIEEIITGSRARIEEIYSFESQYDLDYYSVVENGWRYDSGILNNLDQKIQDNDYYQNFSYSIRSKIPFEDWNDVVSSLLHTTGLKKFSDLQVESEVVSADKETLKISPLDATTIQVDYVSQYDLNCVSNYDLVTENYLQSESSEFSDQISFSSRIITDYSESVGNRVLTIDDVSSQFNSNPRSTPYSNISRQPIGDGVATKFVVLAKDRLYTGERQVSLVTVLNNTSNGQAMISQYGDVDTVLNLGDFDYTIEGSEGVLQFYPTKFKLNNYNLSVFSYNLDRLGLNTETVGVGTTLVGVSTASSFPGSLISVASTNIIISGVTTTELFTLAGIGTSTSGTRSAKLVVSIENDSEAEFDELSIIHDGTDVKIFEYGQLTTHSLDGFQRSSGLGTYGVTMSGSDIIVKYTPISGFSTTKVNALSVGLSSEGYVGNGTYDFVNAQLIANGVGIASTSSPTAIGIGSYGDSNDGAYGIIQVSDLTNNIHQFSEFVMVDNDSEIFLTEFAVYNTTNDPTGFGTYVGLGTLGAERSGSRSLLTFTPNPDIEVHVKTYINAVSVEENTSTTRTETDLGSASIKSNFSTYTGTLAEIRRDFPLTHKNNQIFERNFDGADSTIVNLTDNTINIPNHFFVSGQQLTYSTSLGIKTDFISIASTDGFVGVGTTTTLPENVFCIKVDEDNIKLAATAELALRKNPVSVAFTGVGIGNSHTLTAIDANQKVLISIDNMIQSPIAETSIRTTLAETATSAQDVLYFTGITSFFGGDYVQIDDEVVKILAIGIGSTNAVKVTRAWLGTKLAGHTSTTTVSKIRGNYNISGNTINFIEPPYGNTPIGSVTDPPSFRDWIGITSSSSFNGRSFMRNGIVGTSSETYTKNYLYDDITERFNGQTKQFPLTSDGQDVTGISTNFPLLLINGILQGPGANYNYTLIEQSGITSVRFTGTASSVSYDVNNANIPTGGVIVSVGSSSGFGLQPLVAAGGTAVISAAGTVSSISIGNSGSGYRSGIQTTVNVGVGTSSTGVPNIEFIGTAAISGGHVVSVAITNPGAGYTSSNPPYVFFDAPLSYTNLPLHYSASSPGVGGTQAKVDVVVGQGSSVIEFSVSNTGYGYGVGQILTIGVGGTVGIPTDPTKTFEEFKLTIDRVDADQFTAWSVGSIAVLDDFSNLFNGIRKTFPISEDGESLSIVSKPGSNISIQDTLLIFINDILQVPGESYEFSGGSNINFTEAPKAGDTLKFLFYKGTGGVDVTDVDVTETVKVGDDLTIESDSSLLDQNTRTVSEIVSSGTVNTNTYFGPGLSANTSLLRPVKWCRQSEDRLINGKVVSKARDLYEADIFPTTYLIRSVGVGSTEIYVDNVRPFFNPLNENSVSVEFQKEIMIVDNSEKVSAAATAIVSIAGTISSVVISSGGIGYATAPQVTIENPVGVGTSQRATATASISAGATVSSVTITSPGTGYTTTNPPLVLIGPPATVKEEDNTIVSYSGDYGVITGISTTSVGVASTAIVFDLVIEATSTLRNNTDITPQTTISGLSTGDFFIVYDSNVGSGVTSLDEDLNVIGIGTTCLDNIYRVAAVSTASTSAVGFASTTVARVTVSVSDYNGFSAAGLAISSFYGRYSWGKIITSERVGTSTYSAITTNGVVGIQTGPYVIRTKSLKSQGYS